MKKIEKIKKLLKKNYNIKLNNCEYFPDNNDELRKLVNELIYKYGDTVDLNNIYVSDIDDFSYVFDFKTKFNGDVSKWDVSKGKNSWKCLIGVKILIKIYMNGMFLMELIS